MTNETIDELHDLQHDFRETSKDLRAAKEELASERFWRRVLGVFVVVAVLVGVYDKISSNASYHRQGQVLKQTQEAAASTNKIIKILEGCLIAGNECYDKNQQRAMAAVAERTRIEQEQLNNLYLRLTATTLPVHSRATTTSVPRTTSTTSTSTTTGTTITSQPFHQVPPPSTVLPPVCLPGLPCTIVE